MLGEIWHATTPEAKQTAAILHERLADKTSLTPKNELSPDCTSPYRPINGRPPLVKDIIERINNLDRNAALGTLVDPLDRPVPAACGFV